MNAFQELICDANRQTGFPREFWVQIPTPANVDPMKYAMVMTTTNRRKVASAIAKSLLKKGLAACVQVMPISSTFIWKGKIQNGRELLCLIKTRSGLYKKVEKEIARLHNYDLPEIIQVPISMGSKGYLKWIDDSTKGAMK